MLSCNVLPQSYLYDKYCLWGLSRGAVDTLCLWQVSWANIWRWQNLKNCSRCRSRRAKWDRLTVVCVQCIFALRSANRVSRLAHVVSNVSLCVVVYQELSALCVWMAEDHSSNRASQLTIHNKRFFSPITLGRGRRHWPGLSTPPVADGSGPFRWFTVEGDRTTFLLRSFCPAFWSGWWNCWKEHLLVFLFYTDLRRSRLCRLTQWKSGTRI